MLFALLDAAINFYSSITGFVKKSYLDTKIKTFENKLLYYAVYDTNTNRYTLIYNYDNPLSIFWYLVFGVFNRALYPVNYEDLETILHTENMIIVCSYILYGEHRHVIYDSSSYKAPRKRNHMKVIYAYSDTNEDMTHEFERFKETVFEIYERFGVQHVYNMLMGYKQKNPEKIEYITAMTDFDFNEKKLA